MDIHTFSLAHLGLVAPPSAGWAAAPGSDEPAQDAAAWFQGDASGARIMLPSGLADVADVRTLAKRVLVQLTA